MGRFLAILGLFFVISFGALLAPNGKRTHADAIARALAGAGKAGGKDLAHYLTLPIRADLQVEGVGEIMSGHSLAEQKNSAQAIAAYDRAAALIPNLGDWIDIFAATAAAASGDTAETQQRLVGLDSVLRAEWAWRLNIRAYRNAGDRVVAARLAEAAARTTGPARRRAEAWQMLGQIELETNDSAGARDAFWASMKAWPYSDVALESGRLVASLGRLPPDQHLAIGRTYLRFGNRERGIEGLNRYLNSSAAHADTAARVRLEIGNYYFDTGRYRDVERTMLQFRGKGRAEALLLAGRAQYRLDRQTTGKRTLNTVVNEFPEEPAAARALFLLADLAHDERRYDAAAKAFARVIELAPRTEQAGISHMRLATIALSRGDSAEALRRYEVYRQQFTRGARHQQATFWTARLNQGLGNSQVAKQRLTETSSLDPLSFYGQRALALLGEGTIEFSADPVTSAAADSLVAAALLRVDLLRAVGWNEAAAFEQQRVRAFFDADTTALLALGEGFHSRGRTSAGITLGRELLQPGTPPSRRLLRLVYPFPYREQITSAANQYGIDPFFMAALIRQESAFSPTATSGAGAMGLMQVMPSTGRGIARTVGIRPFRTSMLHEPETNIRIGARFLADVMKTWGGRRDFVLSAYNAGPSRMARWRSFPEARDPDLFMERIPFDETRDYVRVVQLNTRIYHMLYGSEGSTGASEK